MHIHPKGANLSHRKPETFRCAQLFVVLSFAIVCRVVAQDSRPAVNLLSNPSFEEDAGDGVSGWKSRAWSGKEDVRWSVSSPGRTGKQCLAIGSEKGADAAWTATAKVKPDTFHRLSGYIKTKDVREAVGALLNVQNMQEVRTPAVSGTKDWTRVTIVFQSGEVTELEINCLFGGWGSSTGQAWYDDVTLEQLDAPPDDAQANVTIDTGAPSTTYSRMVFGGFIEHFDGQVYGGVLEPGSPLSDGHGFRKDVIDAIKELGVSVVRWPGGCFASGYHWKDGVGASRNRILDPVWGVEDPNTFGTDEFVEWCRLIGSEPYICTNAGNGTPEEMQEWVEYCNGSEGRYAELRATGRHDKPLNVRYWSIGNENWGSHEIGARMPEDWGPLVDRSAHRMLSADPELILLAAATPDRGWTLPLLKAAGEHLDYVCIHQYWLGFWAKNEMPDYLTCIMLSDGPEQTISDVINVLAEAGCRGRVKIAFDEWNLRGWHHPGFPRKQVGRNDDPAVAELVAKREVNAIASQYSMADALFSASFLNACLRHAEDVGMANIAPLVNTRGPIYVHPNGIVKRTTFHTLAMYANRLEGRVGKLDLEAATLWLGNRSVPVMDAVATVNESGDRWSIALVNRHPSKSTVCTVKMNNTLLDGQYEATILAGDSPDAFNDIEHPDRVVPERIELQFKKGVTDLPPHSLTIVNVPWN